MVVKRVRLKVFGLMLILVCFRAVLAAGAQGDDRSPAEERLSGVESWFYYLSADLLSDDLDRLIASDYDLVVIDPIITENDNTDYDIVSVVEALHDSGKIVIAYMDIGQAEDFRTYWQPGWGIGDPVWIVGEDPDGWSGDYPVAFWWDEWRAIWFDPTEGLLQLLLNVGFDGIYMDWIEAYSDENVVAFAEEDGVDPVEEMLWFIGDIADYTKDQRADFIVIAQNAPELIEVEGYLEVVDGIAMESIWFDGAVDGEIPEGDCPMPATEDDVDTEAYRRSLSEACLELLDSDPNSQLHTSSEWYLTYLVMAHDQGEFILTVDYALEPAHVAWVHQAAHALGFVPFTGPRALDRYLPPYTP